MLRFLFLRSAVASLLPAEKHVDGSMALSGEDDRHAVSRMFGFVFDVVVGIACFQVIMAEHADINQDWYKNSVAERWRGGLALAAAR